MKDGEAAVSTDSAGRPDGRELLNYIDRYIPAGALPLILVTFGALGRARGPASVLVHVSVCRGVALAGAAGDRTRRFAVAGLGVLVWSAYLRLGSGAHLCHPDDRPGGHRHRRGQLLGRHAAAAGRLLSARAPGQRADDVLRGACPWARRSASWWAGSSARISAGACAILPGGRARAGAGAGTAGIQGSAPLGQPPGHQPSAAPPAVPTRVHRVARSAALPQLRSGTCCRRPSTPSPSGASPPGCPPTSIAREACRCPRPPSSSAAWCAWRGSWAPILGGQGSATPWRAPQPGGGVHGAGAGAHRLGAVHLACHSVTRRPIVFLTAMFVTFDVAVREQLDR